jgi:ABC-type amino acid transport substrate-binding protein
VDGGPDAKDVLRSVDAALDRMRDDGTLARISQSRFGGADLSKAP